MSKTSQRLLAANQEGKRHALADRGIETNPYIHKQAKAAFRRGWMEGIVILIENDTKFREAYLSVVGCNLCDYLPRPVHDKVNAITTRWEAEQLAEDKNHNITSVRHR